MMYVDDTPVNMQKIGSKPEPSMPLKDNIFNDKQNDSFENSPRDLDASNVIYITNVQNVTAITDVSYDLSSTSDISQVTSGLDQDPSVLDQALKEDERWGDNHPLMNLVIMILKMIRNGERS
jgi:hypothetical protein